MSKSKSKDMDWIRRRLTTSLSGQVKKGENSSPDVRNGESDKENAARGGEMREEGAVEGTQGSAVFVDAEEGLEGGEVNGKIATATATAKGEKGEKGEKKKSKKRKRKGRKSKESQESKSQDVGEDEREEDGSQQQSQSRSIAEAMDDARHGHIGESEEYEVLVDGSPNARQADKVNGTSQKKRKRTPVDVEPEDAALESGEGNEEANILNTARASSKTPERAESKESQRAAADLEVTLEPLNLEDEAAEGHIVADLSLLSEKVMKAKEKLKESPRKSSVQTIIVDDDDSGAILHQPLTPAQTNHLNEPNSQEDHIEAEAQLQRDARSVAPPEDVEEEDGTPVRPSTKALGKRKAVHEPIAHEPKNKRARRGKDPTPQGRDIRSYGSLISPAPLTEASKPQFEIDPDESLPEFSQRVYLELESGGSVHRTPDAPAPPTKVSQSVKRVAKKPIMLPPNSFTPINQGLQPASDTNTSLGPLPTSTGRPKRRLPTGEDESSSIKSKKRTSTKFETSARAKAPKTPKTPKLDKKTPKARASTAPHGRVTKEEIDMISEAVETYKELQDLTQIEVNELIHQDAHSQREMWKHICAEVPGMPSRSVQNTCRRKFHNLDRGAFKPEDDDQLMTLYKEYPDKWKQIGHEMNRFPEDVRDRWRNYLVCGNKIKKHVWDIEEEQNLKRLVRKYINKAREKFRYDDDPRMAQADDDDLIDWSSISEMMNHTRSRLQCANKWRKMKAREESDSEDPAADAPIGDSWRLEKGKDFVRDMNAVDKLKLLTVLRDSGAGIENHIPWRGIVKEFETSGQSRGYERMGLKLCFRLLKEKIIDHDEMKFKEIVKLLIDAFESAEPDEPADFQFSEEELPPSKPKSSLKQRKATRISEQYVGNDEDDEDDDNAEETSTITKPRRTGPNNGLFAEKSLNNGEDSSTSRTESSTNKKAEVSVEIVVARENGESSTTKKKTRTRKHKKKDGAKEHQMGEEEEDTREGSSTTKAKRVRDRMRTQDQNQQEAVEDIEEPHATLTSSDDLQQSLQVLKTSKGKPKTRAIRQLKRNKALSEENVVEDENEDDDHVPLNGDTPIADGDRMDFEADEASSPEATEVSDHEEEERYSHSQRHDIESNDDASSTEDQMSSEAEEEYPAAGPPKREESFEDDEEQRYCQSQHHGRASLDLDENTDHNIMRNSDFEGEDSSDDGERSNHHVTTNGDFEESDFDDDDIEDDHSEHYITTNGFHNHEKDSDEDEEDDGYEGMDSTYHDRASPDLDMPMLTQNFKRSTSDRLGSPFLMHKQPAWDEHGRREGSQSISSDDDMEDIPAVLPPKKQRMESVDLDA